MSVLVRWNPFARMQKEMTRFEQEMDRMYGGWPTLAGSFPPVNVWQDANFVYVEAELPGLELNNLEIYVLGDDQLTLKGVRRPLPLAEVEWHRQERGFGAFTRVISLPVPVDPGKIEAILEHGVLLIKMAKSPAIKPVKIPVKAE